ncbi:putative RNA methyltransferase [Anaeromyxobacter oryzisoli]|uniref:putative RNA methyltransferase n=1 Tax=Anaeromyxobacter oryzisoli TaxID=2925408 RepID=UPI001F55BB78|nr:23S rRNA methyltransferase [Anaeromyxobacter sp. SG63]
MHPDVIAALRCPVCRGPLAPSERALRCPAGHAFDIARQGYVSFLSGRPTGLVGDDADMVAARERFLGAGHFATLLQALAEESRGAAPGLVVEVGAGTAHYLAGVLEALPGRAGLAIDLSKHAARRAARAHPRVAAIVADARAAFPLADACAGLVLDVFAPRNGPELRRILRDDGALLVVTPTPEHLAELRPALGLLEVDPGKARRLEEALAPHLERGAARSLSWELRLGRADAHALAAMGPSARHLSPDALAERVQALPEQVRVTASVRIERWRPRRP